MRLSRQFGHILAFLALPCFAQDAPVPVPPGRGVPFPPELQKYLELTSAQIAAINRLNAEYNALALRKQVRYRQVLVELRQETLKSSLDPMALGLRYTELEVMRRELLDELSKTQQRVRAVLTDAQKLRLQTLEQAFRLQPLVGNADCENLLLNLPGPQPGSPVPPNAAVGAGGPLPLPGPKTCGVPVQVIRDIDIIVPDQR